MIVVDISQEFASYLNLRTIHSPLVTFETAACACRFRYFNIMYNVRQMGTRLTSHIASSIPGYVCSVTLKKVSVTPMATS